MEDEDLMLDISDINITQENVDLFDQPDTPEAEPKEEIKEEKDPAVTADIPDKVDETITKDENKKEDDPTKDKESPSSDIDDSSQSTLYALAKHLKEEGVLYLDEDITKVENLDDLKDLIRQSNEKARYANLTESQKRYQDALQNGIPKKEYEEVEKVIQTYQNIKQEDIESNENLRYEIIALDLMDKGIEQKKALKLAKLSLAEESNTQDAKDALNNLIEKKVQVFKQLVEQSQKQTEVALTDIKKEIFNKKELLNMPLNDITKNKLFDLITTKVETDESGMPLNKLQKWQKENPIEANIFLNYMYLMTNEGKDLGLIKKSTDTSAAKELEKKLKSMSFDKNGSLIIPDELLKETSKNSGMFSDNNLTINI